jgi:hypothetical protein
MAVAVAARWTEDYLQATHFGQAFDLVSVFVESRIDFLKSDDFRSQLAYNQRDALRIEFAVDSDEPVNIVAGNREAIAEVLRGRKILFSRFAGSRARS